MVGGRRGVREEEGRGSGLHLAMELTLRGVLNKNYSCPQGGEIMSLSKQHGEIAKDSSIPSAPKNPCKEATQAQRKH